MIQFNRFPLSRGWSLFIGPLGIHYSPTQTRKIAVTFG